MLFIQQEPKSPKVIIDFSTMLFEVSGSSWMDDPVPFYQQILDYIQANFYEVQNSIHYRGEPKLTLHFYMRNIAWQDIEMIKEIDAFLFKVQEFKTYIYWYYDPKKNVLAEKAFYIRDNFQNIVRLIEDDVHV